jgi:mRNA-degrading endonuclease YafQ of YafQ-DinJ toxin-antitoxin module
MEKYFTTEISTKKAEKKEELFLRREQHAVFKHFEKEYITLRAQCKKAIAITRDLQSTVSTEKMNPYLLLQVSKEMTKSSIATQSFNKFVPVLLKMSALHKTVTVAKKGLNPQQKSAGTKAPVFLQAGAKAGAKSDAADTPAGTGYGVVGAEADPVQDLIGLITDLYNYATSELKEIRKEEAIRVEQYVGLMKTLDFVIKDMEDELDEVREHKGEMRKCVSDEAKIELAAANKLDRNKNIKGKTVKMCNSFNKEFAQANKAREEEMNLIQALYDLLEERLKGEMDHEDHDLEWKSKEKSGATYKHDGLSEEKEKFIYEQESFKTMMDSPCSKGSDCNASNGMVCISRFTAKVFSSSETCKWK